MPTTPQAGLTHHVVLRYGDPAAPSYQGLMLPQAAVGGALPFSQEAYNQFAIKTREGDAQVRDLAIYSSWEQFKSLNGGIGQVFEATVETDRFYYSSGTPAIFTAQKGHVLSPPQLVTVDTARKDIIQFLDCPFAGGTQFMALSNTNPGKVYQVPSPGNAALVDAVAGLTVAAKQMHFDGTTLRVTQSSSNFVRKATAITPAAGDWSDDTFKADFIALRENSTIAYVWVNAGNCELVPGAPDPAMNIGSKNVATNLYAFRGALWIGKPEGLWKWAAGKTGDAPFYPAYDAYSSINCKYMAIHNNLLFFNIQNRLFFTDGTKATEVSPDEINGFLSIDCLAATFGPLFFGAHINLSDQSGQTEQSVLNYFASVNDSGLNPVMAAANGQVSQGKTPGTFADDATVGTDAWATPTNAGASDNAYAVCTMSAGPQSHYLKGTNCGFTIPSTATITGVKVDVEIKINDVAYQGFIFNAYLVIGGAVAGSVRAAKFNNTADAYLSMGGSADLWGNTITPANANASDFGCVITILQSAGQITSVDHLRITIFYNVGANIYAAVGATRLFDANGARVYLCESDATNGQGVRYLNMNSRYRPQTYDTQTSANQYIVTTEFTAGFRAINKWWFDVVMSVRNPVATAFCKIEYSIDQGATWTAMVDHTGAAVNSLPLSSLEVGAYFPLNLKSTRIQFRNSKWATNPVADAEIIAFTVRGLVMTNKLYKFAFPFKADELVEGLTADYQGANAEVGATIIANVKTAASQGYPCDLQDVNGVWHRVVIQEPTPTEAILSYSIDPQGSVHMAKIGQLNCVEIKALSGATGTLPAWAI